MQRLREVRDRPDMVRGRCKPTPPSPPNDGVIYFGSTALAMDEAIGIPKRALARPVSAPSAHSSVVSSPTTILFMWSNRTATRSFASRSSTKMARSGTAGADPAL
jgi:hypothetical protein